MFAHMHAFAFAGVSAACTSFFVNVVVRFFMGCATGEECLVWWRVCLNDAIIDPYTCLWSLHGSFFMAHVQGKLPGEVLVISRCMFYINADVIFRLFFCERTWSDLGTSSHGFGSQLRSILAPF